MQHVTYADKSLLVGDDPDDQADTACCGLSQS